MSRLRGRSRRPTADGVLALAGSVLQRIDDRGTVAWQAGTLGAAYVHHVGDLDGTGRPCALVRTDPRTLVVIDVATGEVCWRWQAAAGTYLNDLGGLKVDQRDDGAVLYLFPTYATDGWCFEFAGRRGDPRVRWHVTDLPFDAGFGPSVVLADVDGDGRAELFLSSRTGSEYGRSTREGRTTTAEVVLGREDGVVYQAVMDPATGQIVDDVAFEAVPGAPHRCARPYGLLHVAALAPGELPQAVLASCQVEEYLALTRRTRAAAGRGGTAGSSRRTGPGTIASCGRSRAHLPISARDGRPLLVVGLWQDEAWRTLILDPRESVTEAVAELPGRYFWGCEDIDGDGVPEIITSTERARAPRSVGTLEAWKAAGGRAAGPTSLPGVADFGRVATMPRAAVLASTNSPLPPDVAFMAGRRNTIGLRLADGRSGVLVRTSGRRGPGSCPVGRRGGQAAGAPPSARGSVRPGGRGRLGHGLRGCDRPAGPGRVRWDDATPSDPRRGAPLRAAGLERRRKAGGRLRRCRRADRGRSTRRRPPRRAGRGLEGGRKVACARRHGACLVSGRGRRLGPRSSRTGLPSRTCPACAPAANRTSIARLPRCGADPGSAAVLRGQPPDRRPHDGDRGSRRSGPAGLGRQGQRRVPAAAGGRLSRRPRDGRRGRPWRAAPLRCRWVAGLDGGLDSGLHPADPRAVRTRR